MDSDSDFDGVTHDDLLKEIRDMGRPTKKRSLPAVKKAEGKGVDVADLVGSIKSTRNVGDLKKQLHLDTPQEKRKKKRGETLSVPLHRQAQIRLESGIAYQDTRKELSEWDPIVQANRVSEQLVFPLNDDNTTRVETAAERVQHFEPRTELEKKMHAVLSTSKCNLRNDELYTEAEKELIKAMNLKEAREKCTQMQKMRLLMSYRAAKFKQQAKIKSKQYHRIKKRQKRRQLVKEIEELMARDPEAAKEKLKELEVDRAYERATLKHRGTNKWSKQLRQFATRNPELRKLMQEHLKFGRELKGKHGVKDIDESSSDGSDSDDSEAGEKALTVGEIVELAAEQAYRESKSNEVAIPSAASDPELKKTLRAMRRERKHLLDASKAQAGGDAPSEWLAHDVDADSDNDEPGKSLEQLASEAIRAETVKTPLTDNGKQKNKKKKKSSKKAAAEAESLANITDCINESVALKSKLQQLKKHLEVEDARDDSRTQPSKKAKKRADISKKKKAVEKESPEIADQPVKDISLDPQYFLKFDEDNSRQIPRELIEQMEDFDGGNQEDLMAEAFEDDDVLGEFEAEKEEVESGEKQQDIDLTLHGWGSWTGPGVAERKRKNDRFVLKQEAKKRKDAGRKGVIIREAASSKALAALQPRDVPFPYTSVKDFETVIRQPLGKDWNSQLAFKKLTQRAVVTKAGRIIHPLDKEEIMRQRRLQEAEEDLPDEAIV